MREDVLCGPRSSIPEFPAAYRFATGAEASGSLLALRCWGGVAHHEVGREEDRVMVGFDLCTRHAEFLAGLGRLPDR
jgi:hypothetical protein